MRYILEEPEAQSIKIEETLDMVQRDDLRVELMIDVARESEYPVVFDIGVGGSVISEPVLHQGILYFGACDRHFYAIDAKNGVQKWSFITGGVIYSKAIIHEAGCTSHPLTETFTASPWTTESLCGSSR